MSEQVEHLCSCACGANQFAVAGQPIMRAICHCTICQAFNEAPYADICVIMAKNVDLAEDHSVDFQKYRKPPALQRGKCKSCGKAAVEYLHLGPLPGLAFVPAANFPQGSDLPEPALHMFYHRRVADIDDDLPKYNGYWPSHLATVGELIKAGLRR